MKERAREYRQFLQTPFWRDLSRRKKREAGYRCSECGSSQRLECHHLRYPANWFDTDLIDLEVLCRGCHKKRHSKTGIRSWTPAQRKKPRLSSREKMRRRAREFNTWRRYHQ